MKPTKTVYVKNYTDSLDDVISDPDGVYFPYSIHKIPMELESFTEENLHYFHPLATVSDIQMCGRVFFTIKGLEFEVSAYDPNMKMDGITIKTDFQEFVFSRSKKVNNLNLFKDFKKSFTLYNHLSKVVGLESDIYKPYSQVDWKIEGYEYKLGKWKDNTDKLFIEVKPDGYFSKLYLAYDVYGVDNYVYKGISYSSIENYYTLDDVIDLDYEIKHLNEKREFVIEVAQSLSEFFGTKGLY